MIKENMDRPGASYASSTGSDIQLKFDANILKMFYSLCHVYLGYLNSQKYMHVLALTTVFFLV